MADKPALLRAASGTLSYTVYESGTIVPASPGPAPTVALYTPGGVVLQAAQTATIANSTLSIALSTADTATQAVNYRAFWTYKIGSTTYAKVQLWDVENNILYPTLTEAKLLIDYPDLGDKKWAGVSTFADQRDAAWDKFILGGIRRYGKNPHRIMDPTQLEPAHSAFTRYVIAAGFGPQDNWLEFAKVMLEQGHNLLDGALSAVTWYDENGDLAANEAEQGKPLASIRTTR